MICYKNDEDKAAAEAAYKNVQERIKTCDEDDLADLETKQITCVNNLFVLHRKILIRENLLTLMGVNYYEYEGESDSVCAKMVQKDCLCLFE